MVKADLHLLAILMVWLLSGSAAASFAQEVPTPAALSPEPRVRAAIEDARAAVQRDPKSASTWGRYGMVLEAHRHLTEAAVAYREAQKLDLNEFRWSYFLGCLLEYTDPVEAADQLRRAVELDPEYAPARIRLGQVLETIGESDSAGEHFERAVQLSPSNPLGFFGAGRLALQRGDVSRAVDMLEKADRLEPPIKAVVATLARAYQRDGRSDLAKSTAQRARELPRMTHHQDPVRAQVRSLAVDLESYLERSRTYREVEQLDAALRELDQLLEIDERQARAHLLMADVKDRKGDQEGALTSARRALELDPELAGARPILAGALLKLRRFDEAEAEARRVVATTPDNFHMQLVLAVVAAERNQVGDLIERLDRAYEARNSDRELRGLLAGLLDSLAGAFADAGQRDEAARYVERLLHLAAEDGAPQSTLDSYRRRLTQLRG